MRKVFQNKGFMMVETLIVISIISVSIIAFMAVAQKSIFISRQSTHAVEAAFLLEESAEAVRIVRDNAWSNVSTLTLDTDYYPTFSGGTWTLSLTPNVVGIFTRTVSVASVKRDDVTGDISTTGTDDPGTRLITVTVSWREGGDTITKTLAFYIADIFSS